MEAVASGDREATQVLGKGDLKIKKTTLRDYKKVMEGIFTTCVNSSTIDESPMAYKSPDEILENIKDNAEVIKVIKPIYNFKASEK